jgi:hypothetical protein
VPLAPAVKTERDVALKAYELRRIADDQGINVNPCYGPVSIAADRF